MNLHARVSAIEEKAVSKDRLVVFLVAEDDPSPEQAAAIKCAKAERKTVVLLDELNSGIL